MSTLELDRGPDWKNQQKQEIQEFSGILQEYATLLVMAMTPTVMQSNLSKALKRQARVLACWGQRTPSQESKIGRVFYKARAVMSVLILFGSDKGYYHGVLRRGYWNSWTYAFHHENMMDGWHVSYSYTRWWWHYLDVFTMWFLCTAKSGALLHCIGVSVWQQTIFWTLSEWRMEWGTWVQSFHFWWN